ncbi:hypothetical protein M0R45_009945 [Rubus argutus]|uniref:Lon N-terminal domain-containing protein n=1 Tax=Rubus argutus TaxID=59490 RepID=A0AAW1Y6C3_RUBAR
MEPDTGDLLHRGLRELRVHCQRCPLQVEQQKEVLSIEGDGFVAEVKVPGSLVKQNLEQFTKKYKLKIRLASERQIQDSESNYLMAASQLLDIVEARPSRFPITVNDLFSIMDKASEGTFLLGELSLVERSMFDKNEAIELIDVVARTSFILEKQLLEKEREYSKLLMQSLEEKANAVAQKLIEEEEANYRLF